MTIIKGAQSSAQGPHSQCEQYEHHTGKQIFQPEVSDFKSKLVYLQETQTINALPKASIYSTVMMAP